MLPPTEETALLIPNSKRLSEPPFPEPNVLNDFGLQAHTSRQKLATEEFRVIIRGAIPVILAYILQNSLQTVSIIIVGRNSAQDLSTAAFSYMFAASSGWLIGTGGTTALATLASSTFTGSNDKHDMGILLQRCFVILTLMYLPIAALWAFSEPIFLFLGQGPTLSHDSALFLTCLIPGGLGYVYFEIMKAYLQAQGIMRVGSYVLLITSPLSALLNYIFVHVANWGVFSAPFAVGIGYWVSFLLLVLYSTHINPNVASHWGGWTSQCLSNTRTFLRLAILGVVQMGTEWWAFEIAALAAGKLGSVSIAAQSVIMTADQVIAMVPFGISVTASVRVGNMLGTRDALASRRSAYMAISLGVGLGTVILAILMSTRNVFGKLISNEDNVIALVSSIMPFVATFQIADGLHGACGGILRGTGRQHLGAMVNIVIYYFVGLPFGIHLAFSRGLGLTGIWIGLCMSLYLVGLSELTIVLVTRWDVQVARAFDRMDGYKALSDSDTDEVSARSGDV